MTQKEKNPEFQGEEFTPVSSHRQRLQIGMWAWLLQRVSALALVMLVALHLFYPYSVILQTLTVFFLCLHAALGIRVIILDIGKRVALHRILFASLILLGLIVFVIILKYRILYI